MSQVPPVSVRPGPRAAGILMTVGLTLGGGHVRAGLPKVGAEGPSGMARRESASPEGKVSPWLESQLASRGGALEILVVLESSRDLAPAGGLAARSAKGRFVYDTLRASAREAQAPVEAWLAAQGIAVKQRFWIVNAILVEGDHSLAHRLAARRDVARVVGNPVVRGLPHTDLLFDASGPVSQAPGFSPAIAGVAPGCGRSGARGWADSPGLLAYQAGAEEDGPAATDSVEPGISVIHATDVWSTMNVRGEGIVVASMDTGVEWTHPAIQAKYRGWNGGAPDHSYSWHDSIHTGGGACGANTLAPCDDHNHGTHTTGTMVGDDGGSNQIGVAPGARWVACRNMDQGDGTPARYIECMEWGLAPYPPGADPFVAGRPDLAPDITNNSWGCPPSEGCDPFTLQAAFEAVRAAGQMTIAAAGNAGPSCSSVGDPPAIYDSVFSAGAVSGSTLQLASFSSRGPVTIDGSNRMKPNIAAPGVSVRSSIRGGGYQSFSGTSMASPHTVGAMALLWSAKPSLKRLIGISRCYLEQSAGSLAGTPPTCGGTSSADRPNNMWGWGLVNALAAINLGPDTDLDGIADPCDCKPLDGSAFDAPPAVAGDTVLADHETYAWTSHATLAGAGTVYDVARGLVSQLRAEGDFGSAICLADDNAPSAFSDPEIPPVGDAFYYLVRGQNGCGSGSYGTASDGMPRQVTSCK